jgi:hypothetical protein
MIIIIKSPSCLVIITGVRKIEGASHWFMFIIITVFLFYFQLQFSKISYRDGDKGPNRTFEKEKSAANLGPCSQVIIPGIDLVLRPIIKIPFLKVILRRSCWQRETSDSFETSRIIVVAVACLKAFRR